MGGDHPPGAEGRGKLAAAAAAAAAAVELAGVGHTSSPRLHVSHPNSSCIVG